MLYQPIIRFERGRNRQGLFLYQGYMTYIEPVYNFRVLAEQLLYFQNIEFHIKNKSTILKELDKIGINKKLYSVIMIVSLNISKENTVH